MTVNGEYYDGGSLVKGNANWPWPHLIELKGDTEWVKVSDDDNGLRAVEWQVGRSYAEDVKTGDLKMVFGSQFGYEYALDISDYPNEFMGETDLIQF